MLRNHKLAKAISEVGFYKFEIYWKLKLSFKNAKNVVGFELIDFILQVRFGL